MSETSAMGKLELQAKKKKGSKRYFKSQTENYKISVCLSGFTYVSVYIFFFSDNIVNVVNEF